MTENYIESELGVFATVLNWKKYVAEKIQPFLGVRNLEVGAGIGAFTKNLASNAMDEWHCLEPDPSLAQQIVKEIDAKRLPSVCSVTNESLLEIEESKRFDVVLYIDVLEHIEDDAAELKRAKHFLKPQGNFFVVSPAYQWLFTPFDREIGHFRRYSINSLIAAKPPSMKVVEGHYMDKVGMVASIGNRFLLRSSAPSLNQVQFWDQVLVPFSRMIDPLIRFSFGKSVFAVFQLP